MKNCKFRRLLPILMILCVLLLAACVRDDTAQGTAGNQTEAATAATGPAAEETASEPLYTEPEAPPISFPAEDITVPPAEDPTEPTAESSMPTENLEQTQPQEETLGENELPPVPFTS